MLYHRVFDIFELWNMKVYNCNVAVYWGQPKYWGTWGANNWWNHRSFSIIVGHMPGLPLQSLRLWLLLSSIKYTKYMGLSIKDVCRQYLFSNSMSTCWDLPLPQLQTSTSSIVCCSVVWFPIALQLCQSGSSEQASILLATVRLPPMAYIACILAKIGRAAIVMWVM